MRWSQNELEASRQRHRERTVLGLLLGLVLVAWVIVAGALMFWPSEAELPPCSWFVRADGTMVVNDPPTASGCSGLASRPSTLFGP